MRSKQFFKQSFFFILIDNLSYLDGNRRKPSTRKFVHRASLYLPLDLLKLEAEKYVVEHFPYFKPMLSFLRAISPLRYFAKSRDKTSYRTVLCEGFIHVVV